MHVWPSLSHSLSLSRTRQHFTFIVAVVCVAVGGEGVGTFESACHGWRNPKANCANSSGDMATSSKLS